MRAGNASYIITHKPGNFFDKTGLTYGKSQRSLRMNKSEVQRLTTNQANGCVGDTYVCFSDYPSHVWMWTRLDLNMFEVFHS